MHSIASPQRRKLLGLVAGGTLAHPFASTAQDYPSRPIRMILPFPPGGPTDVVGRLIATRLAEQLGQPVAPENRAGANGVIAAEAVARAPADGHTLLFNSSSFAISASLGARLPYDPLKDFTGAAWITTVPLLLAVRPDFPAQSVRALVELLRANPGKHSYGSGGTGTITHIVPVQLMQAANLEVLHVPYKGSAPAMTDLIGGQLSFNVDAVSSALSFVQSGRVRAIAVTSAQRLPALPDVPTIAETWIPGFDAGTFNGLLAPAGTPRAVIERIQRAVAQILTGNDLRRQLESRGAIVMDRTAAQYDAHIRAEIERWTRVIKAADIKAEN